LSLKNITRINQQSIEPIVPIFLGIHGNLMLLTTHSTSIIQYVLVDIILLVGIFSIFYKQFNDKYMLTKFLLYSGTGLLLIYLDGGVGSFFTIWLFILASYVLYLDFNQAIIMSIVIPVIYALIYPFSTNTLSLVVVFQRTIVLIMIGVFVSALNRNLINIAIEREGAKRKATEEHEKRLHESELNLKLEELNKELKESNEELENFAFIASHDLRAPLSKIILSLQLLNEDSNVATNSETVNILNTGLKASVQMDALITDLLDYSKASGIEKAADYIKTSELLNKVITNLDNYVKDKHAKIIIKNDVNFRANEPLMISLFQNLVQNGIKFNKSEEPQITIESKPDDDSILFSVKDNGIGIKQEDVTNLFKMFQRLDDNDNYPGTGIGLALCKKIVDLHGGRIWVESTRGTGSIFYVKLPISA